MSGPRQLTALLLGCVLLGQPVVAADGDAQAAERQYRVARRLVAEGAVNAATELAKVVALDPQGVLADDALVEQALLEPIPRHPEQLGRIDPAAAERALALFSRVVEGHGTADRALEAGYLRALLLLEPHSRYDPVKARLELLRVAAAGDLSGWSAAARYAVAWLAEHEGRIAQARNAYQRLIVDAPGGNQTPRAMVGLARILLREGRAGEAAAWFERGASAGGAVDAGVARLKELAVRNLLFERGLSMPRGAFDVVAPDTGVRGLTGFALSPRGGALLADAKQGTVTALGDAGGIAGQWALLDPQAVAISDLGISFVAANDRIFRLEDDGGPRPLAAQGDFAPVQDIAVDGRGRLFVLDRRGERLGRIEPGAQTPSTIWEAQGQRLTSIEWDGRRIVAVDTRNKTVVAIDVDGVARTIVGEGLLKPVAVVADPAGRLAVLDTKAATVSFFSPAGSAIGSIDLRASGLLRPTALGLGFDGSLHVYDSSSAAWMRMR